MRADIERARDRGVAHLLRTQRDDGAWVDFDLPVGRSDQWVTGFVGTHLAWVGAAAAARAAAAWLAAQPGAGRWGYNRRCEADADSTAWAALCLAGSTGRSTPDAAGVDWTWLWTHRRSGGFATYLGDDGWCDAHACVTPVVWLALPSALQGVAAPGCRAYLARARQTDGSWPSYWWSSGFYATLWAARSLAAMRCPAAPPTGGWCAVASLATVHSAAELAWLVDLAVCGGEPAPRVRALAAALLGLQEADGGWPPSRCLRVTPHGQRAGGVSGDASGGSFGGQVYADTAGLLTTAAAVLALHDLVTSWA